MSTTCTRLPQLSLFFFFNDTATTEIYPLSLHDALPISKPKPAAAAVGAWPDPPQAPPNASPLDRLTYPPGRLGHVVQDRKSTRLNSSHQIISYAVFCLKKKINPTIARRDDSARHNSLPH